MRDDIRMNEGVRDSQVACGASGGASDIRSVPWAEMIERCGEEETRQREERVASAYWKI